MSSRDLRGAEFDALMQVTGGARQHMLTLGAPPGGAQPAGAHTLELLQFATPGHAYPHDLSPFDNIFQHFAIVVRDMTRTVQRLSRVAGWRPVSLEGPQRLPVSAGGVIAFKFRDPDGHPLELLEFPENAMPASWRAAATLHPSLADAAPRPAPADAPDEPLFLGIDHSAVSVRDSATSIAFYQRLGLEVTARNLNHGRAQHLLDDVPDPHVDVVTLTPPQGAAHVELLGYRSGVPRRRERLRANDTAATRIVFTTDATCPEHILEDPDGHRLQLTAPA